MEIARKMKTIRNTIFAFALSADQSDIAQRIVRSTTGACIRKYVRNTGLLNTGNLKAFYNLRHRYHAKTGIVFDERMLKHQKKGHPERPERLVSIKEKLTNHKLYEKCIEVL